jgi:hypothetical protein
MNTAPLKASATIIILSVVAGAIRYLLLSMQHHVSSEVAVLASYLLAIPLMQLAACAPGLIAGYVFGGRSIILIFIVGVVSYIPFQAVSNLGFNLDIPTSIAHGSAFALTTVVSMLAGAYISQASNNRFKPFAPLTGTG